MTAPSKQSLFSSLVTSVGSLGRSQPKSEPDQMSLEKSLIELCANKEVDLRERKFFRTRWMRFLHGNFANPAHVALCFSVTPQTADNWWNGYNAPEGFFVAKAFSNPATAEQARKLLSWEHDSQEFAAE